MLPGKHVCRCSVSVSWVTDLWAEFIAEIANSNTSPNGMNCDWLMGDILMGGTSPVKRQKSLLFMLDKVLSKWIEAHIFGRPQKSMVRWRFHQHSEMEIQNYNSFQGWHSDQTEQSENSVVWDLWVARWKMDGRNCILGQFGTGRPVRVKVKASSDCGQGISFFNLAFKTQSIN